MKFFALSLLIFLAACNAPKKQEPVPVQGLAGAQKLQAMTKHQGKIDEVINKDQFTYVRIGVDWFALVGVSVKKGDRVVIEEQAVFNEFHSKTLGRRFKKIVFGVLVAPNTKKF